MLKFLVLGAVLAFLYFAFFRKKMNLTKQEKNDSETMVECVKCGTYVSRDESLVKNKQIFCSQECLKEN